MPDSGDLRTQRTKILLVREKYTDTLAELEAMPEKTRGTLHALLEAWALMGLGNIDEAIALVKSMARIGEAQVVQYRKPFSLTDFLSYRKAGLPRLDRTTLYELGTPEVLYLWSGH